MDFQARGKTPKTIKKILNIKLAEWINSIEDESVKKLVKENTIVTGGCIASMLLGEKVKDFDIYFRDHETALRVTEYYVAQFIKLHPEYAKGGIKIEESESRIKIVVQSQGVASGDPDATSEPFEDVYDVLEEADDVALPESVAKAKYVPVFLSSNAITLSDKVQIVVRFFGEAEEIHKNYDFVHCTNFYDYRKRELDLKPEALEALLSRTLVYQGSLYPVCSIIRTRKFLKRGWNINAGQYLKMAFQVSELNLNDLSILEDQLVGVDSAYFTQVIMNLQDRKKDNPNFNFDNQYLVSIIDKIF